MVATENDTDSPEDCKGLPYEIPNDAKFKMQKKIPTRNGSLTKQYWGPTQTTTKWKGKKRMKKTLGKSTVEPVYR